MEIEIKQSGKYHYIEEGDGPVLMLLHGLFGALSNFEEVVDHFSGEYKVVIPMLPIYDMSFFNTNVKELSKYVHSFIENQGYENINLLGNSLGGHVTLLYALHHPEKCSSMVLTGSSGLYESGMGDTYPKVKDYNFIKDKVAYTFYDPEMADKGLVDEVYQTVNDRSRVVRIIAMAKSAIRHNMANDLHRIEVPTCLIWGGQDRVTPPYVAEEFKRLLPNAELHFVDKCGHAPMMERPEEFNKILDSFLSRLYVNSPEKEH